MKQVRKKQCYQRIEIFRKTRRKSDTYNRSRTFDVSNHCRNSFVHIDLFLNFFESTLPPERYVSPTKCSLFRLFYHTVSSS